MFSFERMLKIWEKYGHMYWNGLGYTLLFAFVSVLMGLVLGLVLASGRMASVQSRDNLAVKALKAVAKFFCTAYVEVFRCCFSKRMRKGFRKNEKSMLQNCNKKAKRKGRLQRVKKPM